MDSVPLHTPHTDPFHGSPALPTSILLLDHSILIKTGGGGGGACSPVVLFGVSQGWSLKRYIHGEEQTDRHTDPRLLPPMVSASFLCSCRCGGPVTQSFFIQGSSSCLSSINPKTISHRHVCSQPVLDKVLIETVFLSDSRLWQIDKLTFKTNHHGQLHSYPQTPYLPLSGSVNFSLLSACGVSLSPVYI